MKDLKKKLMAATSMLLVSVVMLTGASYAWYTLSTNPEVTNITTRVSVNQNLEIALDNGYTKATDVDAASQVTGTSAQGSNAGDPYTWGNLVDLETAMKAMDNNVMLQPVMYDPATMNLKYPTYGDDGRVANIDNALTAFAISDKAGVTANGGVQEYGKSASSNTYYDALSVTYWLRSNMNTNVTLSADGVNRANSAVDDPNAADTDVNGVEGKGSYIQVEDAEIAVPDYESYAVGKSTDATAAADKAAITAAETAYTAYQAAVDNYNEYLSTVADKKTASTTAAAKYDEKEDELTAAEADLADAYEDLVTALNELQTAVDADADAADAALAEVNDAENANKKADATKIAQTKVKNQIASKYTTITDDYNEQQAILKDATKSEADKEKARTALDAKQDVDTYALNITYTNLKAAYDAYVDYTKLPDEEKKNITWFSNPEVEYKTLAASISSESGEEGDLYTRYQNAGVALNGDKDTVGTKNAYKTAKDDFLTALTDYNKARDAYLEAVAEDAEAKASLKNAKNATDAAKTAYDTAVSNVTAKKTAYDTAKSTYEAVDGNTEENKLAMNQAKEAYDKAVLAENKASGEYEYAKTINKSAETAATDAAETLTTADKTLNGDASADPAVVGAKDTYDNALTELKSARDAYIADLVKYAAAKDAYNTAKAIVDGMDDEKAYYPVVTKTTQSLSLKDAYTTLKEADEQADADIKAADAASAEYKELQKVRKALTGSTDRNDDASTMNSDSICYNIDVAQRTLKEYKNDSTLFILKDAAENVANVNKTEIEAINTNVKDVATTIAKKRNTTDTTIKGKLSNIYQVDQAAQTAVANVETVLEDVNKLAASIYDDDKTYTENAQSLRVEVASLKAAKDTAADDYAAANKRLTSLNGTKTSAMTALLSAQDKANEAVVKLMDDTSASEYLAKYDNTKAKLETMIAEGVIKIRLVGVDGEVENGATLFDYIAKPEETQTSGKYSLKLINANSEADAAISLEANKAVKVNMYIYLDGELATNSLSLTSELASFDLNIQFTSNDITNAMNAGDYVATK